jgi:DNA-directed RNA polymerase subunit RPC12/RpoP
MQSITCVRCGNQFELDPKTLATGRIIAANPGLGQVEKALVECPRCSKCQIVELMARKRPA